MSVNHDVKKQMQLERVIISKYQTIKTLSSSEKLKSACEQITTSHMDKYNKLKNSSNSFH